MEPFSPFTTGRRQAACPDTPWAARLRPQDQVTVLPVGLRTQPQQEALQLLCTVAQLLPLLPALPAMQCGKAQHAGNHHHQQQLEMQRGVDQCQAAGWERLSDPAFMRVEQFSVSRQGGQIRITLQGRAGRWHEMTERWVEGENL